MVSLKRAAFFAALAVAGSVGAGGAFAQSAEPTREELAAQLKALSERVNQLEESNRTRPTDAEINRSRDAVRTDASVKASAGAVSVTYDKGLIFKTADESFSLRPSLQTQFRYITSLGNSDTRDDETGFEFRRVRPRIQGNAFSKDLAYDVQLDVNRDSGNVTLLDLSFQYKLAPEWAVKFGQFKESITHERDVSSARQLAVERSLAEAAFSGRIDRVQGVALIFGGTKDNPFRAELTFSDGGNSLNRDFRNGNRPGGDTNSNFGVAARGEWKALGEWSAYRDFTAKGTKDTLFVLGAGADRTERGDREEYIGGVDAQLELTNGLGLYAAGYGGHFDDADTGDSTDYAALAQASYLLTPAWELFGRADAVFFDEAADDYYPELAVGVNYYLGRDGAWLHNAKFTLDLTYLPNGYPENVTGAGVLANDDAGYVLRFQFQVIL